MSSRFLNQGVGSSRPRHFGGKLVFSKEGEGLTELPACSAMVRDPPPLSFRPEWGLKLKCPSQFFPGSADRAACCIMLSDRHPRPWGRRRGTEKRTQHRPSFLTWRPQRLLLGRVEGGKGCFRLASTCLDL